MKLALVGGVFNDEGGRPSGYIRKLHEAIMKDIDGEKESTSISAMNGGSFKELQAMLTALGELDALLWMGDIPNDKPKLVKLLKEANPNLRLMISKNNREGKYTQADLVERMKLSKAERLLEFQNSDQGQIKAQVLASNGQCVASWSEEIDPVAKAIARWLLGE